MSIKAKSVKAVVWVAIFGVIRNVLGFLITLVLARLLVPRYFGLMAMTDLVIINLEIVRNLGIDQALIYRQKDLQRAADTAFIIMILSGIFFGLMTYFSAPIFGDFFGEDHLVPVLEAMASILIISGIGIVPATLLEKELKFKQRVIVESIAFIVYGVVAITLALLGAGIWSIVWGRISQSLVQTILLWLVTGWRPSSWGDLTIALEMFRYGKHIIAASVLALGFQYIDNLFIGKFAGVEALGFYTLAYSLANLPPKFTSVLINRVTFPIYSQLQQDTDKLARVFRQSVQMVSLLSLPASTGILVLAPRIILTLYTDRWAGSITALQILSLYGLSRSIGALPGTVFLVLGKERLMPRIQFVVIGLSAIFLYPITEYGGIIGVSLLVTAIITIASLVMIYLAMKYLNSTWLVLLQEMLPQILATVLMLLVLAPLSSFFPFNFSFLIILLIIGSIVYSSSIIIITQGKIVAEVISLIQQVDPSIGQTLKSYYLSQTGFLKQYLKR